MGEKGNGSGWTKIIDREAYNTTESHMHRTHKVIPERRRPIILLRYKCQWERMRRSSRLGLGASYNNRGANGCSNSYPIEFGMVNILVMFHRSEQQRERS